MVKSSEKKIYARDYDGQDELRLTVECRATALPTGRDVRVKLAVDQRSVNQRAAVGRVTSVHG